VRRQVRRNVVLSFQEDTIGIRLRDVIGIDNMMGTGLGRAIVGLVRSFRRQNREGAHHRAGGSNHGELQGDILGQSRV
jgi:hypothetical protein